MNPTNNPKLRGNAQRLRREMTKEERHLWYDFLKQLPLTVNRQKVIGRYIVDFYCAAGKLAIELDGSQHFENEGAAEDRERDHALKELGITVVRYSNDEVNRNFDGVCADLLRRLGGRWVTRRHKGHLISRLRRQLPLKGKPIAAQIKAFPSRGRCHPPSHAGRMTDEVELPTRKKHLISLADARQLPLKGKPIAAHQSLPLEGKPK